MPLRIPVSGLLEDIGIEPSPITIERYGPPSVNSLGDVVHGTPTSIAASAVVHQATRKQLERAGLDLGLDARAVYTREPVQTADGATAPDVIVYDGQRWTVTHVADYSALGGLYLALVALQP